MGAIRVAVDATLVPHLNPAFLTGFIAVTFSAWRAAYCYPLGVAGTSLSLSPRWSVTGASYHGQESVGNFVLATGRFRDRPIALGLKNALESRNGYF